MVLSAGTKQTVHNNEVSVLSGCPVKQDLNVTVVTSTHHLPLSFL